jgi:hypothetical protein
MKVSVRNFKRPLFALRFDPHYIPLGGFIPYSIDAARAMTEEERIDQFIFFVKPKGQN